MRRYCDAVGVEESDAVPRAVLVHGQSRHAIPEAPIAATHVFPFMVSVQVLSLHVTSHSTPANAMGDQNNTIARTNVQLLF